MPVNCFDRFTSICCDLIIIGAWHRPVRPSFRYLSATSSVFHPNMQHPKFYIFSISSLRFHLYLLILSISFMRFHPYLFILRYFNFLLYNPPSFHALQYIQNNFIMKFWDLPFHSYYFILIIPSFLMYPYYFIPLIFTFHISSFNNSGCHIHPSHFHPIISHIQYEIERNEKSRMKHVRMKW